MPRFQSLILLLCRIAPVAMCALSLQAQSADDRLNAQFYNSIAAVAEGEIITRQQVANEIKPLLPRLQLEARNQEDLSKRIDELAKELLQGMVDRILIVKDAEEKGLQIPDTYIESEFKEVINRDFGGDRGRFLEYLKTRNQTPRDFREELRKNVIVSVMRQRNRNTQSVVSPERIQSFYNANKIRFYQHESLHLRQIILTPIAGESPAVLMQTARGIIRDLDAGLNFADLAREYSQDEMSRNGGDWGWIKRKDIRRELSDKAFELDVGEYTEPIELGGNIFILYAEDRREEGIQPVSEVRDTIENMLIGEVARETQERWLQDLRDKAYVKYYL